MSSPFPVPPQVDRIQRAALGAALVGGIGLVVGAFANLDQFLHSYLFAYLFWLGLSIGCLSLTMLNRLSGGMWGMATRRLMEAWTRTLPLGAVLFLPLALGLKRLYPWANPERVQYDRALHEVMHHKALYLNVPFFLGRAAFYLGVWLVLSALVNRWSLQQDSDPSPLLARRLRKLSAGGLLLVALTVTWMSIDWAMSLDATWFSTIYGLVFFVGQGLSAFAMTIVLIAILGGEQPLAGVVDRKLVHDLGKLLFACVMLWAYLSFSQFLIIWSGNQPEEIHWYLRRFNGGWGYVSLFMAFFHFAVPFLLLLSRDLKRNPRLLAVIASWMLFARLVDLYWYTMPEFHSDGLRPHWLDLAAPLGLGGVWVAYMTMQLRRRPLVPVGEADVQERLQRQAAPAHGAHA